MADYTPPEESTYVWFSHYDDIKNYPFYDASGTLGLEILLETGVLPKACPIFDPKFRDKISYYTYTYFLAKVTELLDTIFFVLRKKYKQVSFLHLYHHTSGIIGSYILFRYSHSVTCLYFMTINSMIHVIMYFYYFMSGLGPQYAKYLSWKRHLTNLQRIQFITVLLHQLYSLLRTKCEYTVITIVYAVYSTILYFIMFTNFYSSTYKKSARKNKDVLEINDEEVEAKETKSL
ncbi:unnamed protein product [Diatraea saccharalis]|uniref:Elongation of very long chain fatty acids protein n=1 Tax=Diatraea saccharalis TaxID=40085 RepID=A0A9P0C5P5_9NEOP|nr:unnamed protein product [Diatraea saccharalis]